MNNELKKLIESGESVTVEFKSSFGKEAIETITAFANGEGGFLCIGVGDNVNLKGVVATEEDSVLAAAIFVMIAKGTQCASICL